VGRGVAGFLKPFRRVGGILWLEVSGVFFLLFVVAFAPTAWRTRASWVHGPDHRTFWSAALIMVVFLYLSGTSFWRARRK
jgi:heme/copper-type cytochrome/quinol oxidase subunit 3